MKYMDLYYNIENPLNNNENISKLIQIYNNGGRYNDYVKQNSYNEKEPSSYSIENFYVKIFNNWKDNLKDVSNSKIININLLDLAKKLRYIRDIKTYDELEYLLYHSSLSKQLQMFFLNEIRINSFIYLDSFILNGYKDKLPDVDHRLYLNVDKKDVYDLSLDFIRKCEAKEIPYEFKFDYQNHRDDCFVVYASTKYLLDYIGILEDLKKKYIFKKPPLLTGVFDGFIGYGSENAYFESSYNELRSFLINYSIGQVIDEYHIEKIPFSYDLDFIKCVRCKIFEMADSYNIDPSSFCFDKDKVNLLKEYDESSISYGDLLRKFLNIEIKSDNDQINDYDQIISLLNNNSKNNLYLSEKMHVYIKKYGRVR